jgi:hypothetical protein
MNEAICQCQGRSGDEYYCPIHGGEGCWIDLKVKSDMLIEKLGDWIVNQNNDIKSSAKSAFGAELKILGQTLQKMANETGAPERAKGRRKISDFNRIQRLEMEKS